MSVCLLGKTEKFLHLFWSAKTLAFTPVFVISYLGVSVRWHHSGVNDNLSLNGRSSDGVPCMNV